MNSPILGTTLLGIDPGREKTRTAHSMTTDEWTAKIIVVIKRKRIALC